MAAVRHEPGNLWSFMVITKWRERSKSTIELTHSASAPHAYALLMRQTAFVHTESVFVFTCIVFQFLYEHALHECL